jgi:hypothetical protein
VSNWYFGVMSWFCCGPDSYLGYCGGYGSGACGTCDSPSYQCAWQNLSGFSGCYCGCTTEQESCGSYILVYSGYDCFNTGLCVQIADHGPGSCTGYVNDCETGTWTRIIDLTPAAFNYLAPLSVGITSVDLQTPINVCYG